MFGGKSHALSATVVASTKAWKGPEVNVIQVDQVLGDMRASGLLDPVRQRVSASKTTAFLLTQPCKG